MHKILAALFLGHIAMTTPSQTGYYLMCQNLRTLAPPEILYTATNRIDLYEHFSEQYYKDVKEYCPSTYPEPCSYIQSMAAGYSVKTPNLQKFIYPDEPGGKQ